MIHKILRVCFAPRPVSYTVIGKHIFRAKTFWVSTKDNVPLKVRRLVASVKFVAHSCLETFIAVNIKLYYKDIELNGLNKTFSNSEMLSKFPVLFGCNC